jgi:hypothetical protein
MQTYRDFLENRQIGIYFAAILLAARPLVGFIDPGQASPAPNAEIASIDY